MTREPEEKKSSLSLQTLLISSAAAVVAAVVVPYFWERGSLLATAITPIIVALASEALNRPAKAITAAAPKVARRSATGAALRSPQPTGVGARGEGPERVGRGGDGAWSGNPDDPFGLRAPEPPRRRLPVRLAVITGLIAAVVGAGVVTASELALFGHSVGHSNRTTSLFGGKSRASKQEKATPTATATPRATATATATATTSPEATPTPTVTATATASPQTEQATPPPAATPTATP